MAVISVTWSASPSLVSYNFDWGSVPAYFGGLALLATCYVIGRDRSEKMRVNAEKVAAWAVKDEEGWRILVRNAGDLPCTRVIVWGNRGYRSRPDGTPRLSLSKFVGSEADGRMKPRYLTVIGPGETVTAVEVPLADGPLRVRSLDFRDAAGRDWERRDDNLARRRYGRYSRRRIWVKRQIRKAVDAWNSRRKPSPQHE